MEVILETRDGWRKRVVPPSRLHSPYLRIPFIFDIEHCHTKDFEWDGESAEPVQLPDGTWDVLEIWREI